MNNIQQIPLLEREFSARTRHHMMAELEGESFDLVIIGGGIVGAGVAYEATGRGLKVALVEKGDFACGTSSKSSKLLHGGLRYLEQYEFGLVFEALSARNDLVAKFPHLVKKVPFLMPIYKSYREKPWLINIGCWLYDLFSWISSPTETIFHRFVDRDTLNVYEHHIESQEYLGGIQYYDAMCDDARLALETIKSAHAGGARILNYTQVIGFIKDVHHQVQEVQIQDLLDQQTYTLRAKKVINAAGPWADRVNLLADPAYQPHLRPTKGIHLIVPRLTRQGRAILLKSVSDDTGKRRWIFIIPYGKYSIVGTTDTDYEGVSEHYLDEDNYASANDVRYLLASVNHLYPKAGLTENDVISSYGGWRPLIAPQGSAVHESDISRAHEIFETDTGIIVIAGGKLTTYLYMAEDLMRYLNRHYPQQFKVSRINVLKPVCTQLGDDHGEHLMAYLKEKYRELDISLLERLMERYGSESLTMLDLYRYDSSIGVADIPYLDTEISLSELEIAYMVCYEMPVYLSDVLLRRHRILLRDSHQGQLAAPIIAEKMADIYSRLENWTPEYRQQWIETQLALYRQEVERTNAWRA